MKTVVKETSLKRIAAKTTGKAVHKVPVRRTISPKAATTYVRKNLTKLKKDPLSPEYAGYDLNDLDAFTSGVKAHLGDKSSLSSATLDAADYAAILEDYRALANWKPKRNATVRKNSAAVTAAGEALRKMEITDEPIIPRPRSRRTPVAVAVMVPPVRTVTVAIPAKAEAEPTRKNKIVPANWRYMAENADTQSARDWWTEYCAKRMRGEV